MTFVHSSCFNFYQLFRQNFEEKINYVFSRTRRGKRIQQSCLVFQTNISRTIMSQVKPGHFNDFLGLNMLSVQQG